MPSQSSFQVQSGRLFLEVDRRGSFTELRTGSKNALAPGGEERPLFRLRLRMPNHEALEYTAFDAEDVRTEDAGIMQVMRFETFPMPGLAVGVRFVPQKDEEIHLFCDIDNQTDAYVEFLEFPDVTVPNDLVGAGGDCRSRIFWPFTEGCVVEDASLRTSYHPIEYPNKGWEGYYPGPVQMQFMAYYDESVGLYFGCHDPHGTTKGIEYHAVGDGIRLEYRMFLAIPPQTAYQMDFPMVIGAIEDEWYGAAEKYRQWLHTSTDFLPVPVYKDKSLPEWYDDAPLVVMYPVRGQKDTGNMTPNALFPYEKAFPVIERLAEETGSRIMVLLAHWEGTAPWAPPFIWPPFGGEEALRTFTEKLHEQGHLIGLYASGLGWTDKSVLWPYDRTACRIENGLTEIMVADADQIPKESLICRGGIRYGYDMCGYPEKTRRLVTEEIHKVGYGDIDYLQYFDQTIGGVSYLCYGAHHGHPPVPGAWQAEAMNELYERIETTAPKGCRVPLLGCEAAAAECFIKHLRFNDLRCGIPVGYAMPVPAYAYLFHPYLLNFMGNFNCFHLEFPPEENPQSLLWRMAYSFAAGDALTFVLRDDGGILWGWGAPWDGIMPNQEHVLRLARSMTALRKGKGHAYLQYGEMLKPLPVVQPERPVLTRPNGTQIICDSIVCSRWTAPDGTQAQVLVNYTDKALPVVMMGCAYSVETGEGALMAEIAGEETRFLLPALTAAIALLKS